MSLSAISKYTGYKNVLTNVNHMVYKYLIKFNKLIKYMKTVVPEMIAIVIQTYKDIITLVNEK